MNDIISSSNTPSYQLAQVNIARARAPLDDPIMAEFIALLDEINALADRSPGFVWRLQTESGNAAYIRPYEDDRIIVNLSVWENVESLKHYVYRSAHTEVMRRRSQWFEKFDGPYLALWRVEIGHIPTIEEARERLDHLRKYGESDFAFSLKRLHLPDTYESAYSR